MKQNFIVSSLKQFIDVSGIDQTQEVQRKQYNMGLEIGSDEERTIIATVTTQDCDHDGDVIIGKNMDLSVFMKNPAVMWSHSYNQPPIGKCLEMSVTDTGIAMKMEIARTDMAEECWQLLKGKFLRGCSIGFIATKYIIKGTEEFKSYVKENALKISDKCERIITNAILLENSLCSLGCNSYALVTAISAKSINLSAKTIKELELDKVIASEIIPVIDTPVVSEPLIVPVKYVIVPVKDVIVPDIKQVIAPVIETPVVIPPIVEPPKSYLKVLRHGPVDLKAELAKEQAKRAGRIV